jgi:hypothetical protein
MTAPKATDLVSVDTGAGEEDDSENNGKLDHHGAGCAIEQRPPTTSHRLVFNYVPVACSIDTLSAKFSSAHSFLFLESLHGALGKALEAATVVVKGKCTCGVGIGGLQVGFFREGLKDGVAEPGVELAAAQETPSTLPPSRISKDVLIPST